MLLSTPPPSTYYLSYEYIKDKDASFRHYGSGPDGDNTRFTHLEIFVDLKSGEKIENLPLRMQSPGCIHAIRFRSRSDNIKLTLTAIPILENIHPRNLIYQTITKQKDELQEFMNLYYYVKKDNNIYTYLTLENLGDDTDGLSVIITLGAN